MEFIHDDPCFIDHRKDIVHGRSKSSWRSLLSQQLFKSRRLHLCRSHIVELVSRLLSIHLEFFATLNCILPSIDHHLLCAHCISFLLNVVRPALLPSTPLVSVLSLVLDHTLMRLAQNIRILPPYATSFTVTHTFHVY